MTKELSILEEIKSYEPLKVLFDKDVNSYEKYIASIFNKIKATPDLQRCNTQSILNSIHNAKTLGLEIDARQHCSLIPYGANCTLQVEYKGYLYKMTKYYKDFDYKISLIFKDDEFEVWSEGDNDCYKHKIKNPLARNTDISGVYFYYTYTIAGRTVAKIEFANVEQIKKAMEAAKSKNVWNNWFGEMAKKFIVKRACKSKSSSIPELAKLEEFDNQDYCFKDVTPSQSKTASFANPPADLEKHFEPKETDFIDGETGEVKELTGQEIFDELEEYIKHAGFKNVKALDTFENVTHKDKIEKLKGIKEDLYGQIKFLISTEKQKIGA